MSSGIGEGALSVMVVVIVAMVVMAAAAGRVGAGLGIEGGIDMIDMPAQAFNHFLDHMVEADADAVTQQLHRQMPVTEVPGDANQFPVVMGMDFQQRLRPGADADDAAVHRQSIAIPQPDRLRQVDQHIRTALSPQHNPAAMAAVEVDQNVIDLPRCVPGAGGKDVVRAHQNRKYRCAIGSTVAGSQVNSTPSARTS